MAYDEGLAQRIREVLQEQQNVVEKKMFGGIAFMVNGNMCCGVEKDTLMARVGLHAYESALGQPHARKMDFTGRPMKGMIYIDPEGLESDSDLKTWVERALEFALSLPAK